MSLFKLTDWLPDNTRRILIRVLIILVTIFTCFILAPRIALFHRYPLLFMEAIVGMVGVAFLLKFPHFGIIGLITASLVVPFSFGTGSESSLNISILLVGLMSGLMIVDLIIHRFQLEIRNSQPILPVLFLLVISILAFLSGQLFWFAIQPAPFRAQIGGLAIFILSAFAFLLVIYQIHELRWLEWATWIFVALGSLHILGYIFPSVPNIIIRGATGSLFWTWILTLAFSQALINKKLAIILRFLLGILVFTWLYVSLILTRAWTSGWLPGLVSILVIVWLYGKKLRLSIILLLVVIIAIKFQSIYSFIMIGDNSFSLITRLAAWRLIEGIVQVNPILGVGFANYYWYTRLFAIMGYSVVFNSHNNYVDIIAQTGLLGLGCFLWIAWELGRLGLSLKERAPEGFAKAYVYGALGGLAGTLVAGMLGDWFLPFVYNVGFNGFRASVFGWLFLGGLVAVDQIVQRSETVRRNNTL